LEKEFDYIIAGAGASGLSLLGYMLDEPVLKHKKILLIDREEKTGNDRTWCFWQKTDSPYDGILKAQWQYLNFHSPEFSKLLDIHPYKYKMLRSSDFYAMLWAKIHNFPNVTIVQDEIIKILPEGEIQCKNRNFTGDFIFNSALRQIPKEQGKHYLLQHFKGWFVQTESSSFDVEKPVLMDFRVPQYGDCRFVYVLPTSSTTALVEYTLFSKAVLKQEEYDRELKAYLIEYLGLTEYQITETEYGVIPMTNARIASREGSYIINIGTAGGHTKASTGYTFTFIQRRCKKIAANLAAGLDPLAGLDKKLDKYYLYDSIFLNVLAGSDYPSWRIFHDLFYRLPPTLVLDFLDEKTNLIKDLRLMNASHIPTFLRAGIKELLR
jgi:lycopene beta-cyclase